MSALGTLFQLAAFFVPGLGPAVRVALYVAAIADSYNDQRIAKSRARDAYNASLKDRMQMVDMQADLPRSLVLGRARNVDGVLRRWTTGTHSEKLTLIVALAGHEVDAFETWYANDLELTLDGDGWVQTAPYLKGRNEPHQEQGTLDGGGGKVITLPGVPTGDYAEARYSPGGGPESWADLTAVVSGTTLTLSGGSPGGMFSVAMNITSTDSKLRIRAFRGAAGQDLYASIGGEYAGKLRSTDKFEGIALAVVDLVFDTDVYTAGIPSISALMRGAKVLDPRNSTTAWSQNSALCAYHYARHANGMAVPVGEIRIQDVKDAADACDVSTDFSLRKPDNSVQTVTLPRYQCGMVVPLAMNPRDALDEIVESMAGRWGWAGGMLRLRAGTLGASVFALDASWVAQPLDGDGKPSDEPVVKMTNGLPRDAKVNRITGRCADPALRYQMLAFPAVQDDAAIAADGATYEHDRQMLAVNHIAHAQHLCRVFIRESQAPLRMDLSCNLSAYRVELFDAGTVTLPRFGMAGKTVECIGWRWHPRDGVQLQLAELSEDIFSVAELDGRDPAPNSALPSPWYVAPLAGIAVASGTVALTDGSILTRTEVSWTAHASDSVRRGGYIEVQYWDASQALPAGEWPSWQESGSAAKAVIPGLLSGKPYIFRIRAVQSTPLVRSDWSLLKMHVIALPPSVGLNRDFTSGLQGWVGGTSALTGVAGATAGTAVRLDGNALLYSTQRQAVDPAHVYLVRARLKRDAGSGGNFFVGVKAYDASGNALTNGGGEPDVYVALAGAAVPVDGAWHSYEGLITADQVIPTGSPDRHKFWEGSAAVSPIVVATSNGGNAYYVDYLEMIEVSPPGSSQIQVYAASDAGPITYSALG